MSPKAKKPKPVKPTVTVYKDITASEADGQWKVILKTPNMVRIIRGHTEEEAKRRAGIK